MLNQRRVFSATPYFDDESIIGIVDEIKIILKSGMLADGPQVKNFEAEFAKYTQTEHAVAVNSGTAALEIMLRYFGVEGKEVIVPTNTFVATPTSVLFCGGTPVFADIKAETLCIDPEDVKRKLNSKTAGVIAVHIAGLICPEINELRELCHNNGLFLIEDAAHAHGAVIDQKKAGNLCDGGAFSFYPTKVMTTGQGGMITTNNPELALVAQKMRDHGLDPDRIMVMLGDNWCMSEVTAIIGKYQLANLDEFVKKRNEIAKRYDHSLAKSQHISLFQTPDNIRHSYYKYPLRLNGIDKNKIAFILKNDFGIDTGSIYYPPCHLHPWYMSNLHTRKGDLPISEDVLKEVLCLPIHLGITDKTADYVVDSLNTCISRVSDEK
ncbi:MAG: DegT/DnrJ/EryC1/StrS family aminotransferase [Nitrososphaerota archaeon]|jgi:dTDP-4-amino-4,6-dideoxygalactose transaminase|nr:DegT/DnrJ/EryC1/StrS family aminotransferase [Nitrososphaerota archaeon]